ncbi:MAG: DUF305 domain-containing protein [Micromonosporaceae bacterium]|nr:DUF305 domain-containing protein [Micromonosporaceae bacterium]
MPLTVLAVAAFVAAVAAATLTIDRIRDHHPGERSAEAGFARDMAVHHAQAVEMAELVRDRTDNPAVRTLAVDITLTQQAQIGRMQGWLDSWGLPMSGGRPPMAWMGMPTDGPMPGMATRQQLNELADLAGPAADRRFLQLMIDHHRAGVAMAEAVLEHTRRPEVRRLAKAMVASQTSEIAAMQDLLDATPGAGESQSGERRNRNTTSHKMKGHQ